MGAQVLASGELHVGAAYLLFAALVGVYVAIIRIRFTRATNQAEVLTKLVLEDDGR
jgi:hypothetical protein